MKVEREEEAGWGCVGKKKSKKEEREERFHLNNRPCASGKLQCMVWGPKLRWVEP